MGADFGPVLDWVQQRTATGMFPTAVVGIATSQGTVDLGAFGTTGGRAVRSDDRFRLFSITKPLVGLLVGRAMERGLLSLDTSSHRGGPSRRVPSWPTRRWPSTASRHCWTTP